MANATESNGPFLLVHSLSEPQLLQLAELYRNEWWCKDRTLDDIRLMVNHSDIVFALAHDKADAMVAFARVLTDRMYKAIVFDVIVDPRFRGQGLGDRIMEEVVNHPLLREVQSIELYCLPAMAPFYERMGFSTDVGGCVFMRRNKPHKA
jgi:predicted GNAT family N-acyltransferase